MTPSAPVVNELWPGPYCPVSSLLVNTGCGVLTQDALRSRSEFASAVSRPMQYRASVALAENVTKIRPLRTSTAGPSLTR